MSRRDFIPFELRERHPAALEEIMQNRTRINEFWAGISKSLEYANEQAKGGKYEKLKRVRRRSSANIKVQQHLLTAVNTNNVILFLLLILIR